MPMSPFDDRSGLVAAAELLPLARRRHFQSQLEAVVTVAPTAAELRLAIRRMLRQVWVERGGDPEFEAWLVVAETVETRAEFAALVAELRT